LLVLDPADLRHIGGFGIVERAERQTDQDDGADEENEANPGVRGRRKELGRNSLPLLPRI
jgi:hypothetical protein